jgi:hypothetical protein
MKLTVWMGIMLALGMLVTGVATTVSADVTPNSQRMAALDPPAPLTPNAG